MATDTRVVLVKPGDVLIFGNCGDMKWAEADVAGLRSAFAELKKALGLAHILAFEADIDLAAVPDYGQGA